MPEDQLDFLQYNADKADVWPNITELKEAPDDADDWKEVQGKRQYLE